MVNPVVMVHGWGGSFASTWRSSGLVDLLQEGGRTVIGVDLLGHGEAPKPHEPDEYSDLTSRIRDAVGEKPFDAIGFSLGAITLLRFAVEHPGQIGKLVLAGIGRNVVEPDDDFASLKIAEAIAMGSHGDDVTVQLFVQYANQPGNDPMALAAIMRRTRRGFELSEIQSVAAETLVVIGDQDFAGPGEPLADLLPNSRLVVLRNCDHFATTENFGFFDAVLEYFDAI